MTANQAPNPSQRKSIWRRMGSWLARLIEPSAKVTEPGTRRQVQLLSSFLLAIVVLLVLSLLSTIPSAGVDRSTTTLLVISVILLAAYFISRTGYYRWATLLVVVVFSLAAFATALSDPQRASAAIYSYIPIAFLVAGFLLPIGLATFIVVVDTTAIFFLPMFVSGYSFREAGTDGGIIMTLGALILIFSAVRNLTERERLAVLTRANQALQELQGTLEERVEERTAQLRASAEVGRAAASTLDTAQLLQQTVDLIVERFNFYYAAIFTPDAAGQYAVLQAGTGEAGRLMQERQHRLEIGGASMVGTAIQTRQPQIARQVDAGIIRFDNPLLPQTRSEIALPLIAHNRVLGTLDVQAAQPDAFDENTAAVLQTMADQIAIALSNSAQFEQTQVALQQAQRLYETSTAIAEAENAQSMLEALLTQAAPEADRGIIILYGPSTTASRRGYLEIAASQMRHGSDPEVVVGTRYTAAQLPFVSSIVPANPLVISDATRPDLDESVRSVINTLNVKAAIGVGLAAGPVPLGVLFVAYREPRPLTTADVQPLQTLAGQVASTLYNQRLAQETQSTLQQLDQLNRRLTGQAWAQYTLTTTQAMRQIDLGPGVALDESAESALTHLAAPITLHNAVIGNLQLDDPDRVWTPDDQVLLETVASELSIAVENARLIEQTERRAGREARLNQIAQQLRKVTDIDTILQTATQELSQALDTSYAQAQLGQIASPIKSGNGSQNSEQA